MRSRASGPLRGGVRHIVTAARRGATWRPAVHLLVIHAALAPALPGRADEEAGRVRLPAIEVVATSALPGSGADRDQVPAHVRTFDRAAVDRLHPLTLPDFLEQRVGSVTVNDLQNNPFQPDVQFRGFTASPLLGNPQGLAVFQNGVRVNEPFGDTVNWDLIPDFAIEHIDLLAGSNPVFGLNALGGALALRMKSGFTYEGAALAVSGGSFARRDGVAEAGGRLGAFAWYAGGRWFAEDGWRAHSPTTVRQLFADLAWQGRAAELGASLIAADNTLTGNGVAPVELLAADRTAVFTWPDETENRAATLALRGTAELHDMVALDGTAYAGGLRRRTVNGDAFDAEPCEGDPAVLCFGDDGPALLDQHGAAIATDVLGDDDAGALNRSRTDSVPFGAGVQLTWTHPLAGRPNRFLIGASIDAGRATFQSSTELGPVTPSRTVSGLGLFVSAGNEVQPVDLRSRTELAGVFLSDVLSLTDTLTLTVSGRFDYAHQVLDDRLGTALDGAHSYERFNPAAGLTWRVAPPATLYAGYASASRAPSAAELGCADPEAPCRLPNAFVADPPLDQVVAHTVEAGARGTLPLATTRTRWSLGFFRTETDDDILFVASEGFGRGYFRNAGTTRRQGIELDLGGAFHGLDWYLSYAFLDATFREALVLPSPNNPFAAPDGTIAVEPGDQIPGLPPHQLKVGASYDVTARWRIGGALVFAAEQYLRGDEANLDAPLPSYWVVNLFTRYAVRDWLEVSLQIENAFDQDYATFGTYTETDELFLREAPTATNPRAYGPAAPIGVFAGIRVRL